MRVGMKFLKSWIAQARSIPWLAEGLAVLGLALYGIQSFIYSHQIQSTLDEGNYLYKGYLFASGVYRPFQPYGPWTNKMPLAFLIPGWVETIFGAGLRTGRYFAIFLGLLMLVGVWLACLRLGGRWWASASVWMIAINPILIKIYSQALSEGLSACILVWSCALVVGENRKLWELCLGAIASAVVVCTRQNMLPVIIFIVAYIIWQYGWRIGLISSFFGAFTFILIHITFWPGILQMWLPWLPQKLTPFLDAYRLHNLGIPVGLDLTTTSLSSRLYAFWEAIREEFVPLIGALFAWILWPKKTDWKAPSYFKAAVVLSGLFFVLTLTHALASITDNYCVFCFNSYVTFFIPLGFLIIVVTISNWQRNPSILRQILAGLFALFVITGVAYGASQEAFPALLSITVPRIRGLQIQPGTTELWRMLSNKFGYTYDFLKQLVPTVTGFLIGILILAGAIIYSLNTRKKGKNISPGYLSLVSLFLLGIILTPTVLLGSGNADPDCGDVIAAYETAGKELVAQIPPGSLVYWNGGLSPAPLLYLPNIHIFPALLNDGYAHYLGGDPDALAKDGLWNDELSKQWLSQADFVLLEGRYSNDPIYNQLIARGFVQLQPTQPILTCRSGSQILVFRRKP